MTKTNLTTDLAAIGLTFSIALLTGFLFSRFGLPAPFMLGSLFGVWVFGSLFRRLQPFLGVARWFHRPVVVLLATLIGGTFSQDFLVQIGQWWPTMVLMMVATVIATGIGLFYMIGIRRFEPNLAMLCCLPGGQADIVVIARDLTDKDYVVALCHLLRVLIVFLATPTILALMSGEEGVKSSYAVQAALPSLFDMSLSTLVQFVLLGCAGFLLGKLARLPMPHLLGPLIVSGTAHSFGWVDIPRIGEFVILAQLTIAGGVGARLSKVPIGELASYLVDGIVNAVLIVSTFVLIALTVSLVTDLDFMRLLLAFIPGGLYEVTLLALIFGYDVVFVAFHHTIRVLLVFFSLPVLVRIMKRFEP